MMKGDEPSKISVLESYQLSVMINVLVKSNKKETVQRNSTIDFITLISLLFIGPSMKNRQCDYKARV